MFVMVTRIGFILFATTLNVSSSSTDGQCGYSNGGCSLGFQESVFDFETASLLQTPRTATTVKAASAASTVTTASQVEERSHDKNNEQQQKQHQQQRQHQQQHSTLAGILMRMSLSPRKWNLTDLFQSNKQSQREPVVESPRTWNSLLYQLDALRLKTFSNQTHFAASFVRDREDGFILVTAAVFIVFSVGLMAVLILRDALREVSENSEDLDSGESPRKTFREVLWPSAGQAVVEDCMPAISGRMLANSRDTPVLLPLGPIQAGGEWEVSILAAISQKKILTARLTVGGRNQERATVELWSHGHHKQLLGSVDPLLVIFHPDGRIFGKLVRLEDEYVLEETNGREPRWSLGREPHGMLSFVWLPKGTHRKLNSPHHQLSSKLSQGLQRLGGISRRLTPTHSSRGAVVATASRATGSRHPHLEIMTLSGVDDILVLLCTLGVIAFENAFDCNQHEGHEPIKSNFHSYFSAASISTGSPMSATLSPG
eukprot:TRINITY_DN3898_c2_g3_i1.p1 TRINITY_DN3898_c2_g3~~TRINITY_DN3898_c2_g3_i1.p1  ORF type:complete len:486 (-),score=55.07 TRINITY_DN3898_c2_g3_i1:209-1666(-)